jgi:dTDP-4-amino-4,6-dideoxygalactose transaminase
VPLVDLQAQHREIAEELLPRLQRVLERGNFILGEEVAEFEREFAAYSDSRHCVGVANGTDAVELAVRALDIGAGDEVILPANTFIATALGVARAGATPVLVDCDPDYGLIDVAKAAAAIGPRTRALLPVHLYGQVAPMEALEATARAAGVHLIADAAQAQGARRHGRKVGTFAALSATSFYPGKNLGAYGDAGAVLASSDEIAGRIRALRNYGSDVKYHHPELGFNSRLDTLQAVVLSEKLKRLDGWNASRREAAARYDAMLADVPGVMRPRVAPGNEHIFHLYVIRVARRDAVLERMNAHGIGAGIHYPVPIHLQGAFRHLGHRAGDFPVAESQAKTMISLPLYPQITEEQQRAVIESLTAALQA